MFGAWLCALEDKTECKVNIIVTNLTYVEDPWLDGVRDTEDLLLVEHEVHRLIPGAGFNHGESL